MDHWTRPGLERSSSVDWVVFPHNSGLPRFSAFFATIPHPLKPNNVHCCKFRPLTDTLANHMGVMLVCTPVCLRRDSNSRQHYWQQSNTRDIDSRACLLLSPLAQTSGGILPGPSMNVCQHHRAQFRQGSMAVMSYQDRLKFLNTLRISTQVCLSTVLPTARVNWEY